MIAIRDAMESDEVSDTVRARILIVVLGMMVFLLLWGLSSPPKTIDMRILKSGEQQLDTEWIGAHAPVHFYMMTTDFALQ
ncbi:hypothetical protein [Exiguobacterium flavidum]|uniref:hypothetical protein n=1 Tax=Exiguobacterium flavidum TaxID=2184695 RepID=UPI000DF75DDA|nr:hypothetical protein [Exiguobacterium flavidum]